MNEERVNYWSIIFKIVATLLVVAGWIFIMFIKVLFDAAPKSREINRNSRD